MIEINNTFRLTRFHSHSSESFKASVFCVRVCELQQIKADHLPTEREQFTM